MVKPYTSYFSTTQRYFANMKSAQTALHHQDTIFSAGQDVRQRHCDFVISSLSNFRESAQQFCSFLRETGDASSTSSVNNYALIVALFQIDEQADRLRSLIDNYRLSCHLRTKASLWQKHEIQHKLKKFVQNAEALVQQVSHFIEEAYFLEIQQQNAHHKYNPGVIVHQERETIIPLRRHVAHSALS